MSIRFDVCNGSEQLSATPLVLPGPPRKASVNPFQTNSLCTIGGRAQCTDQTRPVYRAEQGNGALARIATAVCFDMPQFFRTFFLSINIRHWWSLSWKTMLWHYSSFIEMANHDKIMKSMNGNLKNSKNGSASLDVSLFTEGGCQRHIYGICPFRG